MFGLPNQTLTGWRDTLENVLRLSRSTCPATPSRSSRTRPLWEYRDCANLPNDDVQADMYLAASEILQDHGYEHYEISNFAKPGFRSRHNLKYWTGGEYLGFGPCAASDFAGKRFTIEPDLRTYVEGIAHHGSVLSECETIPRASAPGSTSCSARASSPGWTRREYERSYLLPFAPLQQLLERFAAHGLAAQSGSRWYLTPRGWLVSNRIILALQDAQEKSTPLARSGNALRGPGCPLPAHRCRSEQAIVKVLTAPKLSLRGRFAPVAISGRHLQPVPAIVKTVSLPTCHCEEALCARGNLGKAFAARTGCR